MTTTAPHPDVSKALALLSTGHTINETADTINWPASSVRSLANGQKGWLIDEGGRVYNPGRPGHQVQLPDGVNPADVEWARQLKAGITTPPPLPARPVGSIDELILRAEQVDDRRVQSALRAVRATLAALSERLTVVEERTAEEAAKEHARAQALDEVARLGRELAAAQARARELGAKLGKKIPQPEPVEEVPVVAPPPDKGRNPGSWEPGREPSATADQRYSPGVDYSPVDVRAWAKKAGFTYPRNGRFLPGPLVQEWLNAHKKEDE